MTDPILTRQGYVILKVVQHVPGGVPPFKDVEPQVEEAIYMNRMEPAIRAYLTKMREEAFIDIKPGYVDTGASPNETKPVFSAYVPPSPKKKQKVERTRYRESTRTFRQKSKAGSCVRGSRCAGRGPGCANRGSGKASVVALAVAQRKRRNHPGGWKKGKNPLRPRPTRDPAHRRQQYRNRERRRAA